MTLVSCLFLFMMKFSFFTAEKVYDGQVFVMYDIQHFPWDFCVNIKMDTELSLIPIM